MNKINKLNPDKIGAWVAVLIGVPFGAIFSYFVLVISLLPFVDFVIYTLGGSIFWYPVIWGGIIPATFIFLLWTGGKKIKSHLDKKYSILHASFLFVLFVNSWLFGLFIVIFIFGGLFLTPFQTVSFSNISLTAIVFTILTYLIATVFTALTLGLIIVSITKYKIHRLEEELRNEWIFEAQPNAPAEL